MNEINYTPIEVEYAEANAKTKLIEYIKENKALVFTISGFTILTVLVSGVLILNRIKENKVTAQMNAVQAQTKKTVSASEVKSATDTKLHPTSTPVTKTPTLKLTRPPTRTPTKTPTSSPTPSTGTNPTNTPTYTATPVPPNTSAPVPTTAPATPTPSATPTVTLTPTVTPTPTPTPPCVCSESTPIPDQNHCTISQIPSCTSSILCVCVPSSP